MHTDAGGASHARRQLITAVSVIALGCGGSPTSTSDTSSTTPSAPAGPKQVTRVAAYVRSDAVAWQPTVTPATNVQGAQATLASATGAVPAIGALSLTTSIATTISFSPLNATAPGYQDTTYPWYAADTAQTVAMGMYPSVPAVARPGFVKGIDFMDSGGGLMAIYQSGQHALVMDRVKSLDGANLVRTNEALGLTRFTVATNTVTIGPDAFGVYNRAMYTSVVGQAHARGLQFEMGLEVAPFGPQPMLNTADAADYAARSQIPVTNTAFWDAFYAALRPAVLDRAAIARDLGVEYLDLWNLRFATRVESSRFQKLVADIRALGYTGKLVYYYDAALETGFPEWGSVDAGFRGLWDVNGAAIHTTVSKATPGEVLADSQPRSRMRTSIASALNGLAAMPQPVIVMMRVPSIFGGVVHADFIEPCIAPGCSSLAPSRIRDYAQQADAYQAVAEVVNATPTGAGRVMGILTAQYYYFDDFFSGGYAAYDKSNSVRGKPAEGVLAWWFKRW